MRKLKEDGKYVAVYDIKQSTKIIKRKQQIIRDEITMSSGRR